MSESTCKQRIVIDMAFDDLMSDIHGKRLAKNYADELKTLHEIRSKVESKYYKKK